MDYLNIKISDLRTGPMTGSEPRNKAIWLFLCAYCAQQENGGVIADCADWTDRQWLRTCAVGLNDVKMPSELWRWHGNDLHCEYYPIGAEEEGEM